MSSLPENERLRAIVTGRVQGVGFRFFVKQQSEALRLTGWVRNLPEGQVEVLAEGPSKVIDRLLQLLSVGPTGSVVIDITTERGKATGEFSDFRVLSGY